MSTAGAFVSGFAEIPQKHDFSTWSIQIFVRKKKQIVRIYITWLTDLAKKFYDVETFLNSFYAMY